jgi:O-antigen/teichoic acid export membrane protein
MKGLARLSALSVGLKMVRFVLGIGSSALLTRLMPIHDYGIYAYALVIATLLAIPGEAGMPNLAMREIARARTDGDQARLRGMVTFANLTVLLLTLTMGAVAAVVLWLLSSRLPPVLLVTMSVAYPALLLGALANTRAGIQRGLGSPLLSQLPEQIIRPGAMILFSLALWLIVGRRLSAPEAMIAYALASATAFGIGAVLLYRAWRRGVGPGAATYRTRPWLAAVLPFSAIAGLQMALSQVAAFLLGMMAPPAEIAAFRIAAQAAELVVFSMFAINTVVAPQIAELFHKRDTAQLQVLIDRVNQLNLMAAIVVAAGLILVGPWGFAFGFGEAYRAAYLPMCVLAIGNLAGMSMGFAMTIANMAGRERLTLVAAVLGLALNATLSLLLCPHYGAMGAAIAASVTGVALRVFLSWQIHRTLGIRAWGVSRDFELIRAQLRRLGLSGNGA